MTTSFSRLTVKNADTTKNVTEICDQISNLYLSMSNIR